MLRWRLILGAVFISLLAALVWIDGNGVAGYRRPGMALLPLALLLTLGGTQEFLSMVRSRVTDIAAGPIYVGNLAIVGSAAVQFSSGDSAVWTLAALVGAVLVIVLGEIFRYDKDVSKNVTERIGLSMLGVVYVGLLTSFIVRLRLLDFGSSIIPLVSMIVVVKMADIGAYTVGRLIGKHKMAPKLSPGKTWEGLAGGILFSIVGGVLVAWTADSVLGTDLNRSRLAWWIVYAAVVGLTGTAGDLIESLLKRDFGRKDSSTWMPGFGGVLDLIDSPLLAAPVAWAFWHWGWMSG